MAAFGLRSIIGSNKLNELNYHFSSNNITTAPADGVRNTQGGFGVTIPEVFPENNAGLIPVIDITGLSSARRQPAVPHPVHQSLDHGQLLVAARQPRVQVGRPRDLRAEERKCRQPQPGWLRVCRDDRRRHGVPELPARQPAGTCTGCSYTEAERDIDLNPAVLDCVAGMFTVAHRSWLEPPDAFSDMGRQAPCRSPTPSWRCSPTRPRSTGCGPSYGLGLSRRPGRVADGVAVTLDEVDRSRWDQELLQEGPYGRRSGAWRRPVRLEAAISGLHSVAPSFAQRPTGRGSYCSTEPCSRCGRRRQSRSRCTLRGLQLASDDEAEIGRVEEGLQRLADVGPSYARRDAAFALADLSWRAGRRDEAAERYREIAGEVENDAVRAFCLRRAGEAG